MRQLSCIVCGSGDYRIRFPERLPPLDDVNFSARRAPQTHHARIVQCTNCGLVYSNPYFDDELLKPLYREASYIDELQLANMSDDYLHEFTRAAKGLDSSARVLEIGCANGFFLEKLCRAGFSNVYGVEPGRDAVEKAAPALRERIMNDFFDPGRFAGKSFDVICCFQIFDHLPDPSRFVREAGSLLKPGGILLAINHNIRAPITRILGERSPMYDIEHIYLFDRRTIRRLFEGNGFDVMRVASLWNSYTLGYAIKMFPSPHWFKEKLSAALNAASLDRLSLRVPAGNMVTVARKREHASA